MKGAEDYINMSELSYKSNLLREEIIKKWIKQAQIDAIEAAVKKCAESAEIWGYYNEPCKTEGVRLKRLKRIWQNRLFKVEVNVSIDKQSILQIAEQLISKL